MTTYVYIDDPIYIRNTGASTLNLDYEKLRLNIGGYYENDHDDKPVLEVTLDSKPNNWEPLDHITLKPNTTLYLGYEDIVGEKSADNLRYFDWMGKSLRFRVVKTLKNDSLTTGSIVSTVKFYPQGLQYTIEEITRTNCDNDVRVFIELTSDADTGYFSLDTKQYYWVASDQVTGFKCEMVPQGGLRFEIVIDSEMYQDDPFDEPETEDWVWTLQLQEKGEENLGFIACERNFTIPEKPGLITIEQIRGSFPINGKDYELPSKYNPYALLTITDNYKHSSLRKPYIITDGGDLNEIIDEVPTAFEDLSDTDQEAKLAEFETLFETKTDDFYDGDNPYSSYFAYRYKEWFNDQNASSPSYRIEHPYEGSAFSIYRYHEHYHTHSCTHWHEHEHCCHWNGDPYTFDYTCDEDNHWVDNADPHNLCDDEHTHEQHPGGCDLTEEAYDTHTHTAYHKHIHTSHTGIHNHTHNPSKEYYDYTIVRKGAIWDGTGPHPLLSDFSQAYNNVEYITLTTTGFNAQYIIRRNGQDIPVDLWTKDNILTNVYPDKGIAQTWYEDFYAIYKEKWMEEEFGLKVPILVEMVNQQPENSKQHLILTDHHGCDYGFDINVDAPRDVSFSYSNIGYPSHACANEGSATITYNHGGAPPYEHAAGDLINPEDQIVVTNLIYGNNPIKFTDTLGQPHYTYNVPVSGPFGITSASIEHQTCNTENGKITVYVTSVSG